MNNNSTVVVASVLAASTCGASLWALARWCQQNTGATARPHPVDQGTSKVAQRIAAPSWTSDKPNHTLIAYKDGLPRSESQPSPHAVEQQDVGMVCAPDWKHQAEVLAQQLQAALARAAAAEALACEQQDAAKTAQAMLEAASTRATAAEREAQKACRAAAAAEEVNSHLQEASSAAEALAYEIAAAVDRSEKRVRASDARAQDCELAHAAAEARLVKQQRLTSSTHAEAETLREQVTWLKSELTAARRSIKDSTMRLTAAEARATAAEQQVACAARREEGLQLEVGRARATVENLLEVHALDEEQHARLLREHAALAGQLQEAVAERDAKEAQLGAQEADLADLQEQLRRLQQAWQDNAARLATPTQHSATQTGPTQLPTWDDSADGHSEADGDGLQADAAQQWGQICVLDARAKLLESLLRDLLGPIWAPSLLLADSMCQHEQEAASLLNTPALEPAISQTQPTSSRLASPAAGPCGTLRSRHAHTMQPPAIDKLTSAGKDNDEQTHQAASSRARPDMQLMDVTNQRVSQRCMLQARSHADKPDSTASASATIATASNTSLLNTHQKPHSELSCRSGKTSCLSEQSASTCLSRQSLGSPCCSTPAALQDRFWPSGLAQRVAGRGRQARPGCSNLALQRQLFGLLDLDGDGHIGCEDVREWYLNHLGRWKLFGNADLPSFEDVWHQLWDMVRPSQPWSDVKGMSLADLRASGLGAGVCAVLLDLCFMMLVRSSAEFTYGPDVAYHRIT